MYPSHLVKLVTISIKDDKIRLKDLINLYEFKVLDYIVKDIKTNRSIKREIFYANRAIDVIEQSYTKKYSLFQKLSDKYG